ncbi:dTDP-4-dehydrorhamnose 3,5-epimerase [Pontimicrobium aquaticum]|uniref:dTDP-4-dehydrorhamnose 3,5-epimerase n=1 Tax=Pontimicrobium aquaticum TaxID=2565367 RepID=A0A4U0ESP7_9FLAO|nr:dTDP-4-dehydrorhamnose 3,5-epimerase [Pontimicrobium aquaticum]TJY34773.1 dTDP-4-dehydrorhamnose 3,5-epimerase [Pontimicrobium aquaticum]
MHVEETYLKGCFILTPNIYHDTRGLFFESYSKENFNKTIGKTVNFVQDNHSVSNRGVLRGLHFQTGDSVQAKLVRVVKGSVLDVCVDIRPHSETFGKHFSIILDSINHKQLFIPRGFAHGFLVLEDNTIFNYKCDNYYSKNHESGLLFNDASLDIDWKFPLDKIVLSEKDKQLPTLESLL